MKYIVGFLLPLALIPGVRAADLSIIEQANNLTVQGHQQLDNGNTSGAYKSWTKALTLYRSEKHEEGIKGSLVNQSLAHQQLGQYFNACFKLSQALEVETQLCQPNSSDSPSIPTFPEKPNDLVHVLALQNFGSVLRGLGHLEPSEQILKHAISSATTLKANPQLQASRLSLANTYTTRFQAARQQFQISGEPGLQGKNVKAAAKYAQLAIDELEKLQDTPYTIQATLNWLALYDEMDQWVKRDRAGIFEITAVQDTLTPKRSGILQSLAIADFSQLPPIESLYAKLKLSKFLTKEEQPIAGKAPRVIAFEQTQSALEQANQLNNPRALSFVYGKLGNLYSQSNQADQAVRSYELAAQFAQADQAWDALYQWRSALADMYLEQGETTQAISSYKSAISALEKVRWNLLPISSDLQFSFKEQVEPVYQRYMELLLRADNPDLKQVTQTNQSLRIAELQNFLRCGETNLIPLAQSQPQKGNVTVQVIDLEDKTVVIVGNYHYSVDHLQLQQTVSELTANIQNPSFYKTPKEQYLPLTQSLYQLVLEPAIAQNLIPEDAPIRFHLNGPLQNIPMAMLHDGKRFLIDRNPIALSNGYVKNTQIQSSQPGAVVGGVSTDSPSLQETNLEPLPEVTEEIEAIQKQFPDAQLLLNQKFTHENLLKNVERPTSRILHLSTHGQFSSDSSQTFLLAWDRPLNVKDVSGVLEAGNGGGLDLLFLSACHSAAGDPRSLLGLAGLSAQSGADNTVASLWSADAAASVVLSQEFYAAIKDQFPMNKALRQAQLQLIDSPYAHPYYWANYVLVQL